MLWNNFNGLCLKPSPFTASIVVPPNYNYISTCVTVFNEWEVKRQYDTAWDLVVNNIYVFMKTGSHAPSPKQERRAWKSFLERKVLHASNPPEKYTHSCLWLNFFTFKIFLHKFIRKVIISQTFFLFIYSLKYFFNGKDC